MTSKERLLKQFLYLFVFLVVLGLIFFGIYRKNINTEPIVTPTPTLTKPIEIQFVKFLRLKDFDYDIIAKIRNPNAEFGSSNLSYELEFYNQSGEIFSKKIGNTYILPGQTKYIVDTPVRLNQQVLNINLVIKSVQWQKLENIFADNISLVIANKNLRFNPVPNIFANLNGTLSNSSDFDFDQVDVLAVLYDENSQPVAVGKTNLRTVVSGSSRAFEIKWFDKFIGIVRKIDIEIHTNLFENSNFIRRYGTPEKFQEFY